MSYYKTLGIERNFTSDQIRKAYRSLCLECHPDRNPGNPAAEERFKQVSVAYQVLSDPGKRREYDLSQTFGGAGAKYGFDPSSMGFDGPTQQTIENMVDMFTDFMENSPLFAHVRADYDREEAEAAKRKPPKRPAKKAPKTAAKKPARKAKRVQKVTKKAAPSCSACGDSKFQTVRQGQASFKIRCQDC